MSSRNHRKRTKPAPQVHRPDLVGTPGGCPCPDCKAKESEVRELVTMLRGTGEYLLKVEDPVIAEIFTALIADIGATDDSFVDLLFERALPRLERSRPREALAIALGLCAVGTGRVAQRAREAADRLVNRDILAPAWADELSAPVVGEEFHWLHNDDGVSILTGAFARAGREHGFLVVVDPDYCDAAVEVSLIDAPVGTPLRELRERALGDGIRLENDRLTGEEFRWRVENALDARRVHKEIDPDDDLDLEFDDADFDPFDASRALPGRIGMPPVVRSASRLDDVEDDSVTGEDDEDDAEARFAAAEVVLRTRLAVLPMPGKPPARHATGVDDCGWDLARAAAQDVIEGGATQVADMFTHVVRLAREARWRAPAADLPAVPLRDGPAPAYQIKITLRGSQPRIWRRLEVPADITLDRLHRVLQVAFGWRELHLHVFETRFGTFSARDTGFGWKPEAGVRLDQVLDEPGDGVRYTYDLGNDWQHDLVLEKVLPGTDLTGPPRCTGGRRAAPPEDCGGIWSYQEILDLLEESEGADIDEDLDWLGIGSPDEFDPEAFDADEVSRRILARV